MFIFVQLGVNSRVRSAEVKTVNIFLLDCLLGWIVCSGGRCGNRLKSVISIKHIFMFHMKNNESHFK